MNVMNRPILPMSIQRFCEIAMDLQADNDKHADFVNFALTGVLDERQAVLDPILDSIGANENFMVLRDYDSLIGIDEHISITRELTVYPASRRQDTLHKNIHLSYRFSSATGDFTAQVHKIPNICLGKWATHNAIQMLFPGLYGEGRSPILTKDEQTTFYEKGLRPAVVQLLAQQADEWPPTYNDELFRARGQTGAYNFQTKMVPTWLVGELGETIRQFLAANGVPWGVGLLFLHQIRGVKVSTSHSLEHDASQEALDLFLRGNDLDPLRMSHSGSWWIDVGLEVSSVEGGCLAWRTDSHFHLVKVACELDDDIAHRITSPGSSSYGRDLVSHLPAISGCRVTPGARSRGPFDVAYLQAYTTDKSLTYRPDQGHYGKFMTASNALTGKSAEYMEDLYALYTSAAATTSSSARLEIRVPFASAGNVLLNITEETFRDSLVSIPREVWSLRSYRALAIKYALDWQVEGDVNTRCHRTALVLTATLTWLLNSMHSTMDVRSASRDLLRAALPHVDRVGADPDILPFGTPSEDPLDDPHADTDSDDQEDVAIVRARRDAITLPAYPYGLIFLNTLRLGVDYPVPRFARHRNVDLSERSYIHFFKVDIDKIRDKYFGSRVTDPRNPARVGNRARATPHWHNLAPEPVEDKIFDLAALGYALAPTIVDRELEGEIQSADPQADADEEDLDLQVSQLWRQFLIDIAIKTPNMKARSSPSYSHLDADARRAVTEDTYRDKKLSNFFVDCQWKLGSKRDWVENFNRLFPPFGFVLGGGAQHYNNTTYYKQWERMRGRMDRETCSATRERLLAKFKTLYWMPLTTADRIWWTRCEKNGFRRPPGTSGAAPHVLINGREPTW